MIDGRFFHVIADKSVQIYFENGMRPLRWLRGEIGIGSVKNGSMRCRIHLPNQELHLRLRDVYYVQQVVETMQCSTSIERLMIHH